MIRDEVEKLILKALKLVNDPEDVQIYVERIRTITQGQNKERGFGLRPDYIKITGALIAVIVDIADKHNVTVFSVDTRAWRAQVLGKGNKTKQIHKTNPKEDSIKFVMKMGIDLKEYDRKGEQKFHKDGTPFYDDDLADAVCISLYGFIDVMKQKLYVEE